MKSIFRKAFLKSIINIIAVQPTDPTGPQFISMNIVHFSLKSRMNIFFSGINKSQMNWGNIESNL